MSRAHWRGRCGTGWRAPRGGDNLRRQRTPCLLRCRPSSVFCSGRRGWMLFNSYEFILLFLPVAVAGFALLSRRMHQAALLWLTAASLVFYAYWDWHSVWILVA